MKIIEITKVFTMDAYPKKITKDAGIDIFSDEYLIGCLLVETFGGSLRVLKENQKTEHIKYADYLWNGKLWELKKVSSLNSIDNRMRNGLNQIYKNPGGIILLSSNNNIEHKTLIKKVINRLFVTKITSVKIIVIENKQFTVILKK